MADTVQDPQLGRRAAFRDLPAEIEKFGILAADDPAQPARKPAQTIPEAGHLSQPEAFETPGQSFGALVQTACPLSLKDRRRQTALTGEERLALPGMDEGLDSLEPQKLNPLIISGAPLFADEWIGQSRMGGKDGRSVEAPGGGLDQPQGDAAAQRVAGDTVDAVGQALQQTLDLLVEAAGRICRIAVPRQIDGQTIGIVADAVQPVLRTTGETMQEQTAGLVQSAASAICASRALSRSIMA